MRFRFLPLLVATLAVTAAIAGDPPRRVSPSEISALLESTEFVRRLDEKALVALVPAQSGLSYVGCPNCTGGHQERQLAWSPEHPKEVRCRHCGHRYPSLKYPMSKAVTVRGPNGDPQRYPYWEDATGYRFFFAARADYLAREYMQSRALDLARLYAATGKRDYARRAALIIDRFAQVFPRWCYHYDFPFHQKIIYDGDVPPEQFRPGFRTARWTRWAYNDIPITLIEAYQAIRPSGVFENLSQEQNARVASRIENDLFRAAARQVLANPETYGNMSPHAWFSLVAAGKAIGEPEYSREVRRRLQSFLETRFFCDGAWLEGAPSYHSQIQESLDRLGKELDGQAGLQAAGGILARSREALSKLRLPDGRLVPVHDTWHYNKTGALAETRPFLLPGLGHACLGGGRAGRQAQFHLTWSGGYGHQHADNLSLIVFAAGRELLSDIGYTHTKYKSWAVATASHNTVVVDEENQQAGRPGPPSEGSLHIFDAGDPLVQVVSAGGERAYPGKVSVYRRTLIVVGAGTEGQYAVDLFEVEGGKTHDYFLHGDANRPSRVTLDAAATPLAALLPPGFDWRPTRHEGQADEVRRPHSAYGFLHNLRSAEAPTGRGLIVRFLPAYGDLPGLRATLFPETSSTLVAGDNPSIRAAGEDEAALDSHSRPFVMLRHRPADGRSRFAAVLEPYGAKTHSRVIQRIDAPGAALALKLVDGDLVDFVVAGARNTVALLAGNFSASFRGEIGAIRMRGAKVEHAYALGDGEWRCGTFRQRGRPRVTADLLGAGRDALTLGTSSLPAPGQIVRLVTADGWTYAFTVTAASAEGGHSIVRLVEAPGLVFDPAHGRLRLTAFPQREHQGRVRVEWFR